MVKSPTWQLARVYIYTLPFANLDMILGNAWLLGGYGFCVAFQILSEKAQNPMNNLYDKQNDLSFDNETRIALIKIE